jgi:hypothetical protein
MNGDWAGIMTLLCTLQMMRQSPANQDERVGGNTPLLDTEDPLFDGPILGHSSATDSLLFSGRLSPLEGRSSWLKRRHGPSKHAP